MATLQRAIALVTVALNQFGIFSALFHRHCGRQIRLHRHNTLEFFLIQNEQPRRLRFESSTARLPDVSAKWKFKSLVRQQRDKIFKPPMLGNSNFEGRRSLKGRDFLVFFRRPSPLGGTFCLAQFFQNTQPRFRRNFSLAFDLDLQWKKHWFWLWSDENQETTRGFWS